MINLSTLPTASAQEVFDHIADHLLTQKRQCIEFDHNGQYRCQYKNSQGLSCAAGSVISENEYNESFEGYTWNELVKIKMVPHNHAELIRDLQIIHDTAHRLSSETFYINVLGSLLDYADEHNFNYNLFLTKGHIRKS